ncbi:MAG TPA: DUF202 domain-containing protein [Epsilonproteobacteria bacterium]|nr:DUF202 domain-containing protein [Campylobacterota bacterium]
MNKIDPKDLMAVERSTTALIGLSISLIVLGFVVEKFELFLHVVAYELKGKSLPSALNHAEFYNYLGIFIVAVGIGTALYTYRYYTKWIDHLDKGEVDTDKKIYFLLSIIVAFIGGVLLASMIIV